MRYEVYMSDYDWSCDADNVQDEPILKTDDIEVAEGVIRAFYRADMSFPLDNLRKFTDAFLFDNEEGEWLTVDNIFEPHRA